MWRKVILILLCCGCVTPYVPGRRVERPGLLSRAQAAIARDDWDDAAVLIELTEEESADPSAETELENELDEVEQLLDELETRRMLGGPSDAANAIVSINAGAGGTEACGKAVFADKNDVDYQKLLSVFVPVQNLLKRRPRADMPGFVMPPCSTPGLAPLSAVMPDGE